MKGWLHSVSVLIMIAGTVSCGSTEVYRQSAKTLDSLSGALNQCTEEIRRMDTVTLAKALTRYNVHKQFIAHNKIDTLSRSEGDALQQFTTAGKNLEVVQSNRSAVLMRSELLNTQINHLRKDIKNEAIEPGTLPEFMENEKKEVSNLIRKANEQVRLFYASVEELKLCLPMVEQVIRRKNKGQLPIVVKDTTSL